MANTIEATTRRFRARARLALFVRQALWMTSVAAAAAGSINILIDSTRDARAGVLASALVTAILMAAVVAYRRTPSVAATASMMDARLGLQDHVRAALEVEADESPVASLIVRAAANRLRGVSPRDIFPFAVGRRVFVSAAVIGASLVTVGPNTVGNPVTSAERSRGGPSSGPQAAERGPAPTTQSPTAAERSGSAPQQSLNAGNEARPSPSGPQDVEARDGAASTRTVPTDARPTPSSPSEDSRMRVVTATEANDLVRPGNTGLSAKQGANTSKSGAGTSSATAANNGASGRGAATAGGPSGIGTGGVSGEPRRADGASVAPSNVAASVPAGVSAARAGALAAAALARDDIPLSRRQYVRDYFLRMQSQAPRP